MFFFSRSLTLMKPQEKNYEYAIKLEHSFHSLKAKDYSPPSIVQNCKKSLKCNPMNTSLRTVKPQKIRMPRKHRNTVSLTVCQVAQKDNQSENGKIAKFIIHQIYIIDSTTTASLARISPLTAYNLDAYSCKKISRPSKRLIASNAFLKTPINYG